MFEQLEAGLNGWTRADTLNYIKTHHTELAQEDGRSGGHDTIDAGAGNDIVYGQEGNDIIHGGSGNDTIHGGSGNDTIHGDSGHDTLTGGSGADTFKWNAGDAGSPGSPAIDTVKDFSRTAGDKLDLKDMLQGENSGNLTDYLHFTKSGADTVIHVSSLGTAGGEDQQIVLQGVDLGADTHTDQQILDSLLGSDHLIVDK